MARNDVAPALHLTACSARGGADFFAVKSRATSAHRVRSAPRPVSNSPPGMARRFRRPAEPMEPLERSRSPGRRPSLVLAPQASASGIPNFGSRRRPLVNSPIVRVARSRSLDPDSNLHRTTCPSPPLHSTQAAQEGQFIRRGVGPSNNEIAANCCITITSKEQRNTWTPISLLARAHSNLARAKLTRVVGGCRVHCATVRKRLDAAAAARASASLRPPSFTTLAAARMGAQTIV